MTSITSNESVGSGRHVMSPSTQPTILAMILTLYMGALAQSFERGGDSEAIAAFMLVWLHKEVGFRCLVSHLGTRSRTGDSPTERRG